MIENIDKNIWIVEGECVDFYGFAYPTRSVVIKLNGTTDLWVWSPVRLTPALKQSIDAIGTPKFLVSPNKIHHLFLSEWSKAYPNATLWGPASTVKKRPDLNFSCPLTDEAPAEWQKDIDQVWMNGSKFLDEIIFFHRPSKTAILADMSENFSNKFLNEKWPAWQRVIARLWGIVEGRGYAPLEIRITTFDRKEARKVRDKMLGWSPVKVVMAHGVWQRSGGTQFLEKAFSWM